MNKKILLIGLLICAFAFLGCDAIKQDMCSIGEIPCDKFSIEKNTINALFHQASERDFIIQNVSSNCEIKNIKYGKEQIWKSVFVNEVTLECPESVMLEMSSRSPIYVDFEYNVTVKREAQQRNQRLEIIGFPLEE